MHDERASRAGIPTTVTFQVTDRCNYDCVHCYQEHDKQDELSFEEVDAIMTELAELGVLFLTLMGGEFFMRRDANKILQRAHDLGFAIKLLTTGHHIHERRADFLQSIRPLQVDISIYSASHKTHDEVTTHEGSWERSIEAAKRLIARDIPVTFKTPVMQSNIATIGELVSLSKSLGAQQSLDGKITGKENFDDTPVMLRMDAKDLAQFYSDESTGIPQYVRAGYQDFDPSNHDRRPLEHTPCRAGTATAAINPNGDVWPCNALPLKCGNLREQSFAEIWDTSSEMKDTRTMRWADISECNRCGLRHYCQRCHGMALVEQKKMAGPSLEACRHAVALRDSLRDSGVIPETETEMPPTWDRVDKDGQHERLGRVHLPVISG